MKAIEIHEHMKKKGTWVNWNSTTDYFHAGDPNKEITSIAVAWQGRTDALKKAAEMGCDMFITHEQIEYPEQQVARKDEKQPYQIAKEKFIKDSGIVIYRCHDVWDRVPEIGIVHAWGKYLGFTDKIADGDPHTEAVYKLPPKTTLGELADHVVTKTKPLGQRAVNIIGDPKTKVFKVGVGCGAGVDMPLLMKLGADVIVATEDSMRYWERGSWALDIGLPLVIVNHTTAEEPGLMQLAKYLTDQFGVKATFLEQGAIFQTVGTAGLV